MMRFDAGRGLRSALAWTAAGCGAAQVHPACGRPVPQASGSESGGPGPQRWNASHLEPVPDLHFEPIQDRHREPIQDRHRGPVLDERDHQKLNEMLNDRQE